MATLSTIAKWADAQPYLANLKETVIRDIRSLLTVPGAAPFSIAREVLCYVDHLGHLYTGRGDRGDVGARFRAYMKDVMSKADAAYARRAEEVYQMYRNGPVHEFAPKVLENKRGQLLAWFMYVGPRAGTVVLGAGQTVQVRHLDSLPSQVGGQHFWLPVSTSCLVDDLVCSIEQFGQCGPEDERVTAWNRAVRDLEPPRSFDFEP